MVEACPASHDVSFSSFLLVAMAPPGSLGHMGMMCAQDEIRRLQANVARSLSQNQQLAAVLAEARAELQGSRACAEERAQALQLQVCSTGL